MPRSEGAELERWKSTKPSKADEGWRIRQKSETGARQAVIIRTTFRHEGKQHAQEKLSTGLLLNVGLGIVVLLLSGFTTALEAALVA